MADRNGHFTPTQRAILTVLSDGEEHTPLELIQCLAKGFVETEMESARSALAFHLHALRKVLRPKGEDIVCRSSGRRLNYQHVRLLANPYDGKT